MAFSSSVLLFWDKWAKFEVKGRNSSVTKYEKLISCRNPLKSNNFFLLLCLVQTRFIVVTVTGLFYRGQHSVILSNCLWIILKVWVLIAAWMIYPAFSFSICLLFYSDWRFHLSAQLSRDQNAFFHLRFQSREEMLYTPYILAVFPSYLNDVSALGPSF